MHAPKRSKDKEIELKLRIAQLKHPVRLPMRRPPREESNLSSARKSPSPELRNGLLDPVEESVKMPKRKATPSVFKGREMSQPKISPPRNSRVTPGGGGGQKTDYLKEMRLKREHLEKIGMRKKRDGFDVENIRDRGLS